METDVSFKLSAAAEDVFMERKRQVLSEGWSMSHDDNHDPGELASAGCAYAMNAVEQLHPQSKADGCTQITYWWPWHEDWWKPTNPRRDLIKAAALIIAEIEKLDRKEMKK